MVSAVTSQKIGSENSIIVVPHVPNSSSATYLTKDQGTTFYWEDMRDYEYFAAMATNAVLTGNGLTLLDIWAADDAIGTNALAIVTSGVLAGTTVGKGGFVECTAAQIREVSAANSHSFRYVTAKLTVANSADVLAVMLLRAMARHPFLNLTPAVTAF